jgi:hypothetical protein
MKAPLAHRFSVDLSECGASQVSMSRFAFIADYRVRAAHRRLEITTSECIKHAL